MYIFSRINRYISQVFLKWFVICSLGILTIISLFETIEMFRKLMSRPNTSMGVVLEILLLKLPHHLELLLPFIILATTMITLWRLNQSSELTVMRASGISIWQITSGLALMAGTLGMLYITLLNPIQSILTNRVYFLEDRYFGTQHNALMVNPSGVWLKDIQDDHHHIFHAQQVNLEAGVFSNVSLYTFTHTSGDLKRYIAKRATLGEKTWSLSDVDIYTNGKMTHESNIIVPTNISPDNIKNHNAAPETISFWKMPEHIHLMEKAGLSSLSYRLYHQKQIAKIAMMIVMALLATAFSLRPVRFGRTSFLITSGLATGLAFHFITDFSFALGLGSRLPIEVAAGTPVLFGFLLSMVLLLHIEEGRRGY